MKTKRAISLKNLLLTLVVSLLGVLSASAQKSQSPAGNMEPSLTYVGTSDGHMKFLLSYENESSEKLLVIIADSNGTTFYEEVYSDKKFSKIFSIPVEVGNITLSVTGHKKKSDQKFQVTTERRVTEEVIVSKPSVKA